MTEKDVWIWSAGSLLWTIEAGAVYWQEKSSRALDTDWITHKTTGSILKAPTESNLCIWISAHNRSLVAFREDSWFKSLFVRKVDPRKDAHSHLLAKKEDSNLYKIQCLYHLVTTVMMLKLLSLTLFFTCLQMNYFLHESFLVKCFNGVLFSCFHAVHNVKPECLDAYNELW